MVNADQPAVLHGVEGIGSERFIPTGIVLISLAMLMFEALDFEALAGTLVSDGWHNQDHRVSVSVRRSDYCGIRTALVEKPLAVALLALVSWTFPFWYFYEVMTGIPIVESGIGAIAAR